MAKHAFVKHKNWPVDPYCAFCALIYNHPKHTDVPPDPVIVSTTGFRHGETYDVNTDYARLNHQARAVWDVMADRKWHTLREIADASEAPEASVSARLRDFRKPQFGNHVVERRRREDGATWEYQMPHIEPGRKP